MIWLMGVLPYRAELLPKKRKSMDLLKYIYFPFVFFLIISVGLMVLIFDFLYELFINLLKSEDDD